MSNEVILAVDDVQEEFFKNNQNKLEQLIGEGIPLTKFSELQNKLIKQSKDNVAKQSGSMLVAPSPLYKNDSVYYSVENFDELYRHDLDMILYEIARNMGAKSYKIEFKIHTFKNSKASLVSRFFSKILTPQGQGDMTLRLGFEKDGQCETKTEQGFDSGIIENPNRDIERIKNYIHENQINIDALGHFGIELKQFLGGNDITRKDDSGFKVWHKVSENSKNFAKFSLDLSLKVKDTANTNNFLAKEFLGFEGKKEFGFTSHMRYKIIF